MDVNVRLPDFLRHHPRRRMIQYSAASTYFRDGAEYWMPAFAGMTARKLS
jgi:hypothetical protein